MDRYRRLKQRGRAVVVLVNGTPALRITRTDEFGDEMSFEETGVDVVDLQAKVDAMDSRLKDFKALLADCQALLAPLLVG